MMIEKPVPASNRDNEEFWLNCSRNRFVLQRCRECAAVQYYPRSICSSCGSGSIEWIESTGKGKVYSFTVIHRASSEAFAEITPYILAIIELNEGPKIMSNIVSCDINDVKIGMQVEMDFEKRAEGIGVPVFKLEKAVSH